MNQVEKLKEKGARILLPNTVYVAPEVNLERVNPEGLIIYPGVRILGERTLIGKDAEIGLEETVTLNNSCLGEKVKVKGGYLEDAVLLDRVEVGKGAHIRTGTLMEEQSSIAHCVGLKQTILMPFVVLGSLINFCDCLMAGGTSRKDHSEVGSSFIHFNFTPYGKCGDKATPSLFGDVPHGVMLNCPRIFLGGEAGVVGPVEIGYGTVLAAGAVYRRDHKEKKLVLGEHIQIGETNFNPLIYSNITSKITKNLQYIGNLIALREWYRHIRILFVGSNSFRKSLFQEAENNISSGIEERIKRLDTLASSLEDSINELKTQKGERYRQQTEKQRSFCSSWPQIKSNLSEYKQINGNEKLRDDFLTATAETFVDEAGYITAIQSLADGVSRTGTEWLNSIVEQVCRMGERER
jgi:UDP-N-acetylglucosamine/UDP-N-acetylgalactosamine diphosphorylase